MNLFRSNATLKPLKAHKAGKRSELAAYSKKTLATLGTGSMKQAVQLPQGENINEWLAVNTVGQLNASHDTTHDDSQGAYSRFWSTASQSSHSLLPALSSWSLLIVVVQSSVQSFSLLCVVLCCALYCCECACQTSSTSCQCCTVPSVSCALSRAVL